MLCVTDAEIPLTQSGWGSTSIGPAAHHQGTTSGEPELVFAPAYPRPGREQPQICFEVRLAPDGSRGVPVFTTRDRLVATLGAFQPWVQVPLRSVRAIAGLAGIDRVFLDPEVDAATPRWTSDDLDAPVEPGR